MAEITLEAVMARLESLERKVAEQAAARPDPPGTTGDEQSDDPAAVAHWVVAFDSIPALRLTPEEHAAWCAAQ